MTTLASVFVKEEDLKPIATSDPNIFVRPDIEPELLSKILARAGTYAKKDKESLEFWKDLKGFVKELFEGYFCDKDSNTVSYTHLTLPTKA